MSETPGALRRLPAVNVLLAMPEVNALLASYGKELTLHCIRDTLEHFRQAILQGASAPDEAMLTARIRQGVLAAGTRSLRKVINATGVVIHTNLGRSPFGREQLRDAFAVLEGYNNLEFNLEKGIRGHRNDHAAALLKFLTGAEDVLVVNNNAAAVMLVLRAFAHRKEVIVSRGELVEIGGSFRVPEIMAASDCKMVEVGTTNKTRIEDYRAAVSPKTALLFKAHRSNYVISGFTEEAGLEELSMLAREMNIPMLYDLGSGLLRPRDSGILAGEPDVSTALQQGADLVCFSGDKLLGGPQAGIIAGRADLIAKLKKEPMLRALRVGKLTLALLEGACLSWVNEDDLHRHNRVQQALHRSENDLRHAAEILKAGLIQAGIPCEIVSSRAQVGGGSLPEAEIASLAVQIVFGKNNKEKSAYAEKMMACLLRAEVPVLGILRQGTISFDLLCMTTEEIPLAAATIAAHHQLITDKAS